LLSAFKRRPFSFRHFDGNCAEDQNSPVENGHNLHSGESTCVITRWVLPGKEILFSNRLTSLKLVKTTVLLPLLQQNLNNYSTAGSVRTPCVQGFTYCDSEGKPVLCDIIKQPITMPVVVRPWPTWQLNTMAGSGADELLSNSWGMSLMALMNWSKSCSSGAFVAVIGIREYLQKMTLLFRWWLVEAKFRAICLAKKATQIARNGSFPRSSPCYNRHENKVQLPILHFTTMVTPGKIPWFFLFKVC